MVVRVPRSAASLSGRPTQQTSCRCQCCFKGTGWSQWPDCTAFCSSPTFFPHAIWSHFPHRPQAGIIPLSIHAGLHPPQEGLGWPPRLRYVTSLVQALNDWHCDCPLGPLNAVTAVLVDGQLGMPKKRFPLRASKDHSVRQTTPVGQARETATSLPLCHSILKGSMRICLSA